MKNNSVILLACACLIVASFLCGLYVGRNMGGGEIQTEVLPQASAPVSTSSRPSSPQNGKININTADIYTLMSLDGIGETYAQRIIEYRETNGPFEKIEDIQNVPGIGEKRFEQIKDSITVGG